MSLPGDGPLDLFGDAITETLDRILAALAADSPQVVDGLIGDRSVNEYVRGKAAGTYLHWVRDGLCTPPEAVRRLYAHLRDAIENYDDKVATGLVLQPACYGDDTVLNAR